MPLNQVDIYDKADLTKKVEIRLDFGFDKFIVSDNDETGCISNCRRESGQ